MHPDSSTASEITFLDKKQKIIPVNSSIKPKIGKDILELLTSGMYLDPLVLFREYIQNSVDSIDQALEENILQDISDAEIQINLDHQNRTILIIDNGKGIPNNQFENIMLSLGDSNKKDTTARGMRGVGRLAGLGYCQSLIFRSSSPEDDYIFEAKWDCRKIKSLLNENNTLDLVALLKEVVSFKKIKNYLSRPHFFEVEIQKPVRLKWDILMNENLIREYLSQVAPVPFSNDFSFKRDLEKTIKKEDRNYRYYKIVIKLAEMELELDDKPNSFQIFKPYTDSFFLNTTLSDSVHSFESIKIMGIDGDIAAVGWILHGSYMGAIPNKALIGGLRARVGNIMIDNKHLFRDCFSESRFSSWTMGEIHVLDMRIIPNGRRDGFEENKHYENLRNYISLTATEISNRCRVNSIYRNKIRKTSFKLTDAEHILKIVAKSYLSKNKRGEYLNKSTLLLLDAEKDLNTLEAYLGNQQITPDFFEQYEDLKKLFKKVNKYYQSIQSDLENIGFEFKGVSKVKLNAYKEIFDLILENSNDRKVATRLIERIIRRIESKTTKK